MNANLKKKLKFLSILFFSQLAFAHGEDKPGPHGGFVQMPGAFHIEVVPVDKVTLKVYLLDMQWKKPSVQDGDVKVHSGKNKALCKPKEDHFFCEFKAPVDINKRGELKVTAKRENAQGNEMSYPLPLKLPETKPAHDGHH